MKKNLLITICGGTGSGKTTVAQEILKLIPKNLTAQIVCQDQFYKSVDHSIEDFYKNINFDHPNSFDWSLLKEKISDLTNNKSTILPKYDYQKSERIKTVDLTQPTDVIIYEGILSLYDPEVNEMSSLKIYVDTPEDERFIRRLLRDKKERNRTDELVVKQWRSSVRPMHNSFVDPQKQNADIIIPWYRINKIALRAINGAIKELINKE